MVLQPGAESQGSTFSEFLLHVRRSSTDTAYNRQECVRAACLSFNIQEVWPTVSMMGMPATLAEMYASLDLSDTIRRVRGTENAVARMPFEVASMRHIPVKIRHSLGIFKTRSPGAQVFRTCSCERWQVFTRSDLDRLVCTCKSVHRWYYPKFHPDLEDLIFIIEESGRGETEVLIPQRTMI